MASMASVHDFHKFAIHHNGVAPALHFHLAASVNPETGKIPFNFIIISVFNLISSVPSGVHLHYCH